MITSFKKIPDSTSNQTYLLSQGYSFRCQAKQLTALLSEHSPCAQSFTAEAGNILILFWLIAVSIRSEASTAKGTERLGMRPGGWRDDYYLDAVVSLWFFHTNSLLDPLLRCILENLWAMRTWSWMFLKIFSPVVALILKLFNLVIYLLWLSARW